MNEERPPISGLMELGTRPQPPVARDEPPAPPPPPPPPTPTHPIESRVQVDAQYIVKHFYTQPDGRQIVGTRFIRDNFPYKITHSHSRVSWYLEDVEAVIAVARESRVPVRDVRLPGRERVA